MNELEFRVAGVLNGGTSVGVLDEVLLLLTTFDSNLFGANYNHIFLD